MKWFNTSCCVKWIGHWVVLLDRPIRWAQINIGWKCAPQSQWSFISFPLCQLTGKGRSVRG